VVRTQKTDRDAADGEAADPLGKYRAKRQADGTPEPMGSVATPRLRTGVFVVHEHDATRRHWDLRIEIDGVLCSWAVPKAPSMDPDDKRLAVKVENHPLEYVDFEAVIPPGNYGAGPMIVLDRGLIAPQIDPRELATPTHVFNHAETVAKIVRDEKRVAIRTDRDPGRIHGCAIAVVAWRICGGREPTNINKRRFNVRVWTRRRRRDRSLVFRLKTKDP
jgi:DNA ligase D-like protein (predicted 3'-phosphoesterase)